MTGARPDAPRGLRSLQARIRNVAERDGQLTRRLELVVADTAVGQMLPPGVIKGGAAMKIRLGDNETRATRDLDAARAAQVSLTTYLDALDQNLAAGWGGFTGTVRELEGPRPDGVPVEYIMAPFQIRLGYAGYFWFNVSFELGRDEVGSTAEPEIRIAPAIIDLFVQLGLPEPSPIPLLPVHHQMAQKLHACTWLDRGGGNDRAHDLVDLQLLLREESPDLGVVAETARRLFESRRAQPWPPAIVAHANWETLYAAASEGLNVIATVDAAVEWGNELIAQIDAA